MQVGVLLELAASLFTSIVVHCGPLPSLRASYSAVLGVAMPELLAHRTFPAAQKLHFLHCVTQVFAREAATAELCANNLEVSLQRGARLDQTVS